MRSFEALACACLLAVTQVTAAYADALDDCRQSRNGEARIAGCSEVIAGPGYSSTEKAAAFRNRGLARANAGALAQALADLTEAIRLDDGDAAAYIGRAQIVLARGQVDAAIADFSLALRLAPQSVPAHIGRGHAHLVKGNAEPAIADFTEALRLDPRNASAFNNRGLAHRKTGNQQAAIDDFSRALALNPSYALALNNRGYAFEALGRKFEAAADFEAALRLDPSLVGAADGLKRAGAGPARSLDTERLIQEGKALVESNCARCHSTGVDGESPNPKAPRFRTLQQRHPVLALREPLARGIAAPHDEMPRFALSDADIDKIIAYINSLQIAAGR